METFSKLCLPPIYHGLWQTSMMSRTFWTKRRLQKMVKSMNATHADQFSQESPILKITTDQRSDHHPTFSKLGNLEDNHVDIKEGFHELPLISSRLHLQPSFYRLIMTNQTSRVWWTQNHNSHGGTAQAVSCSTHQKRHSLSRDSRQIHWRAHQIEA
jgi:hypothetical protein